MFQTETLEKEAKFLPRMHTHISIAIFQNIHFGFKVHCILNAKVRVYFGFFTRLFRARVNFLLFVVYIFLCMYYSIYLQIYAVKRYILHLSVFILSTSFLLSVALSPSFLEISLYPPCSTTISTSIPTRCCLQYQFEVLF